VIINESCKDMKKYLLIFVLGVLCGSGGYWVMRDGPLATKVTASALVQKVEEKVQERAASQVKEEMEKHGKVVMNKPAGASVTTVGDSRLEDLIKAKIAAEPLLSNSEIRQHVQSGDVELRGTATSYEQIARAMRLALECDATRTVVSTIEVKIK
jgi:osmotically-inducible protein OsmY